MCRLYIGMGIAVPRRGHVEALCGARIKYPRPTTERGVGGLRFSGWQNTFFQSSAHRWGKASPSALRVPRWRAPCGASYKQVTSKLQRHGYFRAACRPTSGFTRREHFMWRSHHDRQRFRRFRRYSSARNTRPPCDSGCIIALADICRVALPRMMRNSPYQFASRSLQVVRAQQQAITICRTCDSPDAHICPLCSSVSCGGCTALSR